ncbi:hypothetical protein D3C86_1621530 [compost metagenome]
MQALAGVANQRGQAGFDIQVDVLEVELPLERAGLDLATDLRHATLDLGAVRLGDDALLGQHGRMGQRPRDVEQRQALVEEDRCGVALHQVGHRFGEAGGPGFAFLGKLGGHGRWGRRKIGNRDYIALMRAKPACRYLPLPGRHGEATGVYITFGQPLLRSPAATPLMVRWMPRRTRTSSPSLPAR